MGLMKYLKIVTKEEWVNWKLDLRSIFTPLDVFSKIPSKWLLNDSFSSRIRPKCFWALTFLTSITWLKTRLIGGKDVIRWKIIVKFYIYHFLKQFATYRKKRDWSIVLNNAFVTLLMNRCNMGFFPTIWKYTIFYIVMINNP